MKNRTKVIICGVAAFLLTALGVLLRIRGLFRCYDADIGYFRSGALTPKLLLAVCIAVPVFALFTGIFARKINISPNFSRFASKPGSAFTAVLLLSHAVYLSYYCLGYVGDSLLIPGLFLLFSALASVYFIAGCMKAYEEKENRGVFGFFAILYATAGLAMSYFDFETTMNSPDKLLLQMAYMSVMLYMLFEIRFLVGMGKSGRFTVFSFICFFFCTVSSVPALVAFFSGRFTGILGDVGYTMSQAGCLGFAVFSACRLIDALAGADDCEAKQKPCEKASEEETEAAEAEAEATEAEGAGTDAAEAEALEAAEASENTEKEEN